MSNHHLRNEKLSLKGKGAAFHDAVLAGELELHHQRACRHLQRGRGCYRRGAAGAGNSRVHRPPSAAGPAGPDQRYRVCYLRTAHSLRSRTRLRRIRMHQIRKNPYMEKPDTEKPAELQYREIKYSKINYSWIKYRFHSLPGENGGQAAGTERKGCDVCHGDRELSGVDSGEHRV